MKSIPSHLLNKILKTSLILFFTFPGFAGLNNCIAQSIVGKWNQSKIKTYYTAEGARKYGSPESEISMSTIGTGVFVFYSNHTYRQETTTGDSKVKTILGTWTLTANQLEMQLLPQQENPKDNPKKGMGVEKTTISINGNKMDWTSIYADNALISKIVLILDKN